MTFANKYFAKFNLYNTFIEENASPDLNTLVIIPCFNEFKVIDTLNSLLFCDTPKFSVEVLVVINSSITSPDDIITQNKKTLSDITTWSTKHNTPKFKVHTLYLDNLPKKHAGAGLARKIGMDEAVRRLNSINNKSGIIASLDADTTCKPNYLTELEKLFSNTKINGCSIYFEHPLSGTEHTPEIYNAITKYELYMRYYYQALKWSGHPHAFHTVGSAFAVRVSKYIEQGGMNKKHAGEDFYFLHKIIPLGNFKSLTTTAVYPSSRLSDRVPFGTGPSLKQISEDGVYNTYNFQCFKDLKCFIDISNRLFNISESELELLYSKLPGSVQKWISFPDLHKSISEINANVTTQKNFNTRFFRWFNMFSALKLVNFCRDNFYSNLPIEKCAAHLLNEKGITPPQTELELLILYRKMETE